MHACGQQCVTSHRMPLKAPDAPFALALAQWRAQLPCVPQSSLFIIRSCCLLNKNRACCFGRGALADGPHGRACSWLKHSWLEHITWQRALRAHARQGARAWASSQSSDHVHHWERCSKRRLDESAGCLHLQPDPHLRLCVRGTRGCAVRSQVSSAWAHDDISVAARQGTA